MPSLVLGPLVFDSFEVPQCITFGGRQRLSVHLLPGGGRVVDAMGADEGPITWRGVFAGPAAAARVRVVELLRRSGAAVPLAWDLFRFTVVVESFRATAANPAWITYELKLSVVAAGDVAPVETAIGGFSPAEAEAVGVGVSGLDTRIGAAEAALGAASLASVAADAEMLARLVSARAFVGAAG